MFNKKRGMIAGVLIGVVTIIVAVILMVGVAVPIVKSTVNSTSVNLTGTDLTIGNSLTTFLLIGVLLLIVAISVGVAKFGA